MAHVEAMKKLHHGPATDIPNTGPAPILMRYVDWLKVAAQGRGGMQRKCGNRSVEGTVQPCALAVVGAAGPHHHRHPSPSTHTPTPSTLSHPPYPTPHTQHPPPHPPTQNKK